MLKLVIFVALVAYVLAGVVPKPPASHNEKNESPSVKGVPLHPDLHAAPGELKHKSAEVKHVEAGKPQDKNAKKDEHQHHQASVKKTDQHQAVHHDNAKHDAPHHDNVKHDAPHHAQVKAAQIPQPVQSAKDAHKGQQHEAVKEKTPEHKH